MKNILIFAGTTEGREIAKYFVSLKEKNEISIYVSVATEYGKTSMEDIKDIILLCGRMDKSDIKAFLNQKKFDIVIDATHPFAMEVSKNIKEASKDSDTLCIRLLRDEDVLINFKNAVYVDSANDAVKYLQNTTGKIFATTGSKEIKEFTKLKDYKSRVIARVLSTKEAFDICVSLGFEGKNLIAMQGPFSEEINYEMLKQTESKYLVTKESGKNGGYIEKINACKRAKVKPIIIRRPKEDGYTFDMVLKLINEKYSFSGIDNKYLINNESHDKHISLIGIGMGSIENMTLEALNAVKSSDVIIGAKRVVNTFKDLKKEKFISCKSSEIKKYIDDSDCKNFAILFSGDSGFFSGAKNIINDIFSYDVKVIPGISSISYISAKLKKNYDDAKIISLHGRKENIIDDVIHNKKVILLLNNFQSIQKLCLSFVKNDLDYLDISAAFNMSYDDEKIIKGKPADFLNVNIEGLPVMMIENSRFLKRKAYVDIKDSEFLRSKVPMTKENTRHLSIIKLGIQNDSVIYDIGSGSGSISVEMSLNAPKSKIYAIEKNKEAINLTAKNKLKFHAQNIQIIDKEAPTCLEELEVPTHVFIGGSCGRLKDILSSVLQKNKNVKIVLNIVTIETLTDVCSFIKENNIEKYEIINIQSSYSRKLGGYNLMTGENPIYIVTIN